MDVFTLLLRQLIPLYLLIVLGYCAARWLGYKKEAGANLIIYIIAPVVMFIGIAKANLAFSHITLPILIFGLCSLFCIVFFKLAQPLWPGGKTPHILGPSSAQVSGLNFGFPIALLIFSTNEIGVFLLAYVGMLICDASVGYYIIARGNYSRRQSLQRLTKLPLLYAMIGGTVWSYLHLPLPDFALQLYGHFEGAMVVTGMMMIGQSLEGLRSVKIDWKFISLSFFAKFLVWPAVVIGLIWLDGQTTHLFDEASRKALLLLSILPMALSPIAYATTLDVRPEKVASAVFLSTLFALFYVPFMYMWLF